MNLTDKLIADYSLNWQDLYYFRHDIETIHIAEKQLIESIESFSQKMYSEFDEEKANDKILKQITHNPDTYGEMYAGYYEHRFERKEQIIGTLIQSHRRASVLSIYSLIEGQLKILIQVIENRFNFKIKLTDLNSGDDLAQIWLYLSKVFEIDHKKLEPHFTPLKQQKYIRNKITHNVSQIDENRIPFINEFEGIKVVSFDRDHYISIVDKTYSLNLLEASSRFFKQLIKEMDARYFELVKQGL